MTITVELVNTAPVASGDAYSSREDSTLTVPAPGVLRNDRDADGDVLTARRVNGPAHGTLTLNANGSFRYRPARGFVGTDRLTYRASDTVATSAPVTVTIRVTVLRAARDTKPPTSAPPAPT